MTEVLDYSHAIIEEPETFSATDYRGQEIIDHIAHAPWLNEDWEHTRAIVATKVKSWEQEPSDFVRKLLESRPFLDRQLLGKGWPDLVVRAIDGQHPISVPTDLLVSTDGFKSWAGRDPRYNKDWHSALGSGSMPSLDVIKHYASLPTAAPSIKELALYLQPDGKVLAAGTHDGGHRLAAALLRGDQNIDTHSLRVHYLETDKI